MSDGHAGSTGEFAVELAKVGVVLVPIPPDCRNAIDSQHRGEPAVTGIGPGVPVGWVSR